VILYMYQTFVDHHRPRFLPDGRYSVCFPWRLATSGPRGSLLANSGCYAVFKVMDQMAFMIGDR